MMARIYCLLMPWGIFTLLLKDSTAMNGGLPAENVTVILDTLLDGYDKRLRPNYGGETVNVNVSMLVYSFGPIMESNMQYTMDMYFRQEWMDPRLKFNHDIQLYLTSEMIDRVWVPDTYFVNEKAAKYHEITSKNSLLRINKYGRLLYSTRLTMTASCPMDLALFPFDKQVCSLTLESYAYSKNGIYFHWLKEGAVWIDPSISLPQFSLEGHTIGDNIAEYYVGNYSQLVIDFYLGRQLSYYVIQTYAPSSLIVVVSWVSFWIPRKATPARVALGITTVLTMTTIMGNAGSSLPKLSYMKAIDIFLGICYFYVFAALIEYAVISYYDMPKFEQARNFIKEARKTKDEDEPSDDFSEVNNGDVRITVVNDHDVIESHVEVNDKDVNVLQRLLCSTLTKCRQKITESGFDPDVTEHRARIFFPVTFIIFQGGYWIYFKFLAQETIEELMRSAVET
ncbi:Glycine receptor subunit alpha-3 [Holothuria leucospilota]|uniref:Gamma-aminobutyric acid receptor subunit beta n=1 Tax=Holothuria leucospilota TaxID=206669 RepID=A0A9Q1BJU5_HOLLE|nr:Glycine receptor subunit alpha-3 [Holothuria leucospilota]